MTHRVTLDMEMDSGEMREINLARVGITGGKVIIKFEEFSCKCSAEDLKDAIKFLAKMERGLSKDLRGC